MAKTAYNGRRGDSTFLIPALELCLVGGDGPNDIPESECPDLYRPDVTKRLTEGFLADLKLGQHTPCKVLKPKNGPLAGKLLVTFGNGRTRGRRILNERDGLTGTDDEVLVECQFVRRGTTLRDAEEISMSENANRKVLSGVAKARQAQAYIQRHGDDRRTLARCAVRNAMTVPRLVMLLKTMESADADLLNQMEEHGLGVESVIALAKLPADQQREVLANAKKIGVPITTSKARSAVRASKGKAVAPGRKEIRAEWKGLAEVQEQNDVLVSAPALYAWILGEGEKPDFIVTPKVTVNEFANGARK